MYILCTVNKQSKTNYISSICLGMTAIQNTQSMCHRDLDLSHSSSRRLWRPINAPDWCDFHALTAPTSGNNSLD